MLLNIKDSELDKRIYRIISLERLLELFVGRVNVLVKPALWEDVFENFILKSPVRLRSGEIARYNYHDRVYGQCWTLQAGSDAMWRIYSSDRNGLRIRTTIRKYRDCFYSAHDSLHDMRCCIGKVKYLSDRTLMNIANTTFDDSGIGMNDLFRSLLIKRRAFRHENEVRALFIEITDGAFSTNFHRCKVDPHVLVDQIMVDPRRSHAEFKALKNIIKKTTGYKGEIVRSLLYTLPKDITLDVTDILSETDGA